MRTLIAVSWLGLGLATAPALRAQRTASIEGAVYDSIQGRPLAGAAVFVTRLSAGDPESRSLHTDDRGRFYFDSLPAGRYGAAVLHPVLDSLDLVLPPSEVDVADGEQAYLNLGLPGYAALRERACGRSLPATAGAVVGHVTDADADQPLAGAAVVLEWSDLQVDRETLQPSRVVHTLTALTDAGGGFQLCGAPTDASLVLQLQRSGRVGSVLQLSVPAATRYVVERLSLSERESRPLASLEEDSASASHGPPPLGGTAMLAGTVRSESGQAIAGVELRVVESAGATRSDDSGAFTFSNLPAGTRVIEARRLGYLLSRQQVELRAGRRIPAALTMRRIVSLDSVRILARRSRNGALARRARGSYTPRSFVTAEQIAQVNLPYTSDVLRRLADLVVDEGGLGAKVYTPLAAGSARRRPCPMNVVINGTPFQDVNLLAPEEIAEIEIYRGPAGAPVEYESGCGAVVIWTRR